VRLLVDTHVFLWLHSEPERVRAETHALLAVGGNQVFLSVASVWEMAIKSRLGRLPLPEPLDRYVETRCRATAVSLLAIGPEAAFEVARLPAHHPDPFDRMLIAQARTEKLRLVSHDRAFRKYDVDLVRA
jgi:PIN domain nuclease of toxin-antitoxin system